MENNTPEKHLNLDEINSSEEKNGIDVASRHNNTLLSFLARRKGLIFAILLATGSAIGCDTVSCNCANCEIVKVGKDQNGNVSCSGCSGCVNCSILDSDEC